MGDRARDTLRTPWDAAADPAGLRVVFVLPGLSGTAAGGYKVVYAYANHLVSRQHDVTVIHALNVRGGSTRKRSVRARAVRGLRQIRKIGKLVDYHVRGRRDRPTWFPLDDRVKVLNVAYLTARGVPPADVVVATAVNTARVAATACARQGSTGVYFVQSYEDWMADRDYVEATWRLPLTKVVIADWLEDRGRELGVETVLVPNGIDGGEFPPGPGVADRPCDVVALASDIPVKRLDVLISVVERVQAARPGVRVAAFGTSTRPASLPACVEYVQSPQREALAALYRSAKVYLCTSDAEGWHLPPAEAMSSGAAVVSTDIGGVMAYARGVSSTAPPGDAPGLAQRVVELLDDLDRCQELATAGRERIRNYDLRVAAGAFEEEVVAAWRRDHEGGGTTR
jgi:glycosyltransferase involved in cell wall biosynthesis